VGKEHVCLTGFDGLTGDFLDAEDDWTGGEVLLNSGSGEDEFLIAERPVVRRLHDHLDLMLTAQTVYIARHDRHTPFPLALVLPSNTDHACHGLASCKGSPIRSRWLEAHGRKPPRSPLRIECHSRDREWHSMRSGHVAVTSRFLL